MKKYLLSLLLLSVAGAFNCRAELEKERFSHVEIPNAPPDSVIIVYGPFNPEHIWKEVREKGNWQKFLESKGVKFPKGGFAVFIPATNSLVAATTPNQHEKLFVLLSPI